MQPFETIAQALWQMLQLLQHPSATDELVQRMLDAWPQLLAAEAQDKTGRIVGASKTGYFFVRLWVQRGRADNAVDTIGKLLNTMDQIIQTTASGAVPATTVTAASSGPATAQAATLSAVPGGSGSQQATLLPTVPRAAPAAATVNSGSSVPVVPAAAVSVPAAPVVATNPGASAVQGATFSAVPGGSSSQHTALPVVAPDNAVAATAACANGVHTDSNRGVVSNRSSSRAPRVPTVLASPASATAFELAVAAPVVNVPMPAAGAVAGPSTDGSGAGDPTSSLHGTTKPGSSSTVSNRRILPGSAGMEASAVEQPGAGAHTAAAAAVALAAATQQQSSEMPAAAKPHRSRSKCGKQTATTAPRRSSRRQAETSSSQQRSRRVVPAAADATMPGSSSVISTSIRLSGSAEPKTAAVEQPGAEEPAAAAVAFDAAATELDAATQQQSSDMPAAAKPHRSRKKCAKQTATTVPRRSSRIQAETSSSQQRSRRVVPTASATAAAAAVDVTAGQNDDSVDDDILDAFGSPGTPAEQKARRAAIKAAAKLVVDRLAADPNFPVPEHFSNLAGSGSAALAFARADVIRCHLNLTGKVGSVEFYLRTSRSEEAVKLGLPHTHFTREYRSKGGLTTGNLIRFLQQACSTAEGDMLDKGRITHGQQQVIKALQQQLEIWFAKWKG